jgi:hypothetical protein
MSELVPGTAKLQDSKIDIEYAAARKEGRQPVCPFCGEPLEVRIREDGGTWWRWDKVTGSYEPESEGVPNVPYCAFCLHEDWDFLDYEFIQR